MPLQPGKEDVFNLEEGRVLVQYPEQMTQASFDEFEAFLHLVIRKLKRSIVVDPRSQFRKHIES